MAVPRDKRILLVEDEMIIGMAEQQRLEQDGFNVVLLQSGTAAVEHMGREGHAVDLILMDIDLGKGMDGIAAARSILSTHDVPILFLSSHIENEIVERTELVSSYGYVVKESSHTVLRASIAMAFRLFESKRCAADSARRFAAVTETSMDGFWLVDARGTVLDVNAAYVRMSGYAREELVGMHVSDLDVVEDRAATLAHADQVVRSGSDRFEAIHQRKDGTKFYVEVSVTFIPEQQQMVVFINDISARKAAEEDLREEIQLRRLLFDHYPDGIVIIDPATARIVEFNTAAHRQLGYSREEFAHLAIRDIEAMETPQDTASRIAGVLRTGREDFRTRQRTRDGRVRDVFVTAQASLINGRTVYHCIWRDLTESLPP